MPTRHWLDLHAVRQRRVWHLDRTAPGLRSRIANDFSSPTSSFLMGAIDRSATERVARGLRRVGSFSRSSVRRTCRRATRPSSSSTSTRRSAITSTPCSRRRSTGWTEGSSRAGLDRWGASSHGRRPQTRRPARYRSVDSSAASSRRTSTRPMRSSATKLSNASATNGNSRHVEAYYIYRPDKSTGACIEGTMPVYRVYAGATRTPNHRYVTDRGLRDIMVSQGWIAEGYGPDAVIMCTPR